MKKNVVTFILVLLTAVSYGQDTTYYDSDWLKVPSTDSTYAYCVIMERDLLAYRKATVTTYFKSGRVYEVKHYSVYNDRILDGKRQKWYPNGQLKQDADYKDGQLHGAVVTYWDSGQVKRTDVFKKGKLKSGQCFNKKGEEVPHFDYLVAAEFPGGLDRCLTYLKNRVSYPKSALKNKIGGRVLVRFTVDTLGDVTDYTIIKSAGVLFDKEAIRVVSEMPRWRPAIDDGEVIRAYYTLPISFDEDIGDRY